MANLHIENINPEAVSAFQHASITQQQRIKKLLEYLILQQTRPDQVATPKTAYAFLNEDVWEGEGPTDLADNHDHYLYDNP
jgi:uncharacterized protein YuzB (UPF0349 family)